MQFTIDAKLVRAAMACQSKGAGNRYMLTGILVAKNGDIVGCDGHALFRGNQVWTENDSVISDDFIIRINGTIPAKAEVVTFKISDNIATASTDNEKMFTCELLEGIYPDYNKVIPSKDSDQFSSVLNFDATLLARAEKTFGKNAHIAIHHRGPKESVLVECPKLPEACLVIMPITRGVTGQSLVLKT